jgi:hypothetical protein
MGQLQNRKARHLAAMPGSGQSGLTPGLSLERQAACCMKPSSTLTALTPTSATA